MSLNMIRFSENYVTKSEIKSMNFTIGGFEKIQHTLLILTSEYEKDYLTIYWSGCPFICCLQKTGSCYGKRNHYGNHRKSGAS